MRSLADIIAFNKEHPERCLRYGQSILMRSEATSGSLAESAYLQKRAGLFCEAREQLDGTLGKNGIDCILSAGAHPTSNLAPVSGNPCLSLPAREPMTDPFRPASYYLMGHAYGEAVLLRTAYALEQAKPLRCSPDWVKEYPDL